MMAVIVLGEGNFMRNVFQKRDRVARLVKIQILLWQNPQGLVLKEIARKCLVSLSTIYRDMKALEYEIGVPIWQNSKKWGISESAYLPPINFTQTEAICLLQATRLMQKLSNRFDPNIYSTFIKLNTIIPPPINEQIKNTLEFMEKQPRDERVIRNFQKLMQSWISRRVVRFYYQDRQGNSLKEIIIEPYFIEPLIQVFSIYVIGYCRTSKSIQGYNINHIIGDVIIELDTYEIPKDFNINDYMSQAWDIHHWEEYVNIKLRFSKKLRNAISDTVWHHSQVIKLQKDGSVIMTLKVRNYRTFRNWIIGWGSEVEVLEPLELRKEIANFVKELNAHYSSSIEEFNPKSRKIDLPPVAIPLLK
jgi:predicted DNA-binding transcriptional regulator YafY